MAYTAANSPTSSGHAMRALGYFGCHDVAARYRLFEMRCDLASKRVVGAEV